MFAEQDFGFSVGFFSQAQWHFYKWVFRFLLGDLSGRLFLLQLHDADPAADNPKVRNLDIALLGHVTIPECITYLDNSYVFVGSRVGDSQV